MWVQSQIVQQWLENGALQGSKTASALCKTRLLKFAKDQSSKCDFKNCSEISAVTLFRICPVLLHFPTFMFFTPPYYLLMIRIYWSTVSINSSHKYISEQWSWDYQIVDVDETMQPDIQQEHTLYKPAASHLVPSARCKMQDPPPPSVWHNIKYVYCSYCSDDFKVCKNTGLQVADDICAAFPSRSVSNPCGCAKSPLVVDVNIINIPFILKLQQYEQQISITLQAFDFCTVFPFWSKLEAAFHLFPSAPASHAKSTARCSIPWSPDVLS